MVKRKSKKKEEEEVYHVEVITKARVAIPNLDDDSNEEDNSAGPDWEYYVKWAGYDSSGDSWEPSVNVQGCERLLASFWNHVGIDNKDYYAGDEVYASPEWIAKEKAFFAKEYENTQAEKRKKKEEAKVAKKKAKKPSREPSSASVASGSNVQKNATMSEERFNQSTPDIDHSKPKNALPTTESLKIKLPANISKKRKTIVSSSSEEEPLSKMSRPKKMTKTHEEVTNNETDVPSSPNSLFSDKPEIVAVKHSKPQASVKEGQKLGRRATNPQVKIAGMTSPEIPTSSIGISTKQRLAQGALAPTTPKEIMAQPSKAQSRPVPGRLYTGLNFKKRSVDTAAKEPIPLPSRNIIKDPTLNSLNSAGAASSPSQSFNSPKIPVSGPSFLPRKPSLSEATVSPAMVYQASPIEQAENFLRDIMPASLAAPMDMSTTESPVEIQPPKPVNPRTAMPLPERPKKDSTWSGKLFLQSDDPLCNVKIFNVTQETSFSFSMIFQDQDTLEVKGFYDIVDIRSTLSAFRKPSQMGELGPNEESDTPSFKVLASYMKRMHKAFCVPIILDNNIVGQVLCFSLESYSELFSEALPDAYANNAQGQLILFILPYTLSPAQLQGQGLSGPPVKPPETVKHTTDVDKRNVSLRKNPQLQHALNMLKFPLALMQYLGDRKFVHPYAIWSGREAEGLQPKAREGMETRLLESIMDMAQAKRISSVRSDSRVVFVHLSALRTIHLLPEFVERRRTFQHIQFYLYGTDPEFHPSLWSVREIWPCGGIATFTPSAIRTNPYEVYNLIMKFNSHPLWACYIIPAVLGMIACKECGVEDPVSVFDQRTLSMDMILQAIEDGDVALIEAPPEHGSKKGNEWMSKYIAFMPPTKREALQTGVTAFKEMKDPSNAMDSEIVNNMTRIHRHPAFMFEHRRYAVICSETDSKLNSTSDAFEWTTAAKFDFKDDFFPKQKTIGKK